jgi:hypothetical protein
MTETKRGLERNGAERVRYYGFFPMGFDRMTGIMRTRHAPGVYRLFEYLDRGGSWIADATLFDELHGCDGDAEPITDEEAAAFAARFGATL